MHRWDDPLLPFILHTDIHLTRDDADLGNFHCHFTEPIALEDITAHARISKYHFLRRFKQSTGCTVVTYIHLLRCRRASELLLNTDERISTVARMCGFDSPSYFTKTFARVMGMRPAEYRAAHAPRDGSQK